MLTAILIAAAVVLILSILIGVLLGVVAEKFKVETDEREPLVRDCLAGSNCGGCGYAGCDAYAHAIVAEGADPGLCPASNAAKIGEVMGVSVETGPRKVAFVRCSGTCAKTIENYQYRDITDCRIAYLAPGHGAKKCTFGCLGYGSCAKACPFDAIRVVDGLAVVDKEKCHACGRCVAACPNHLIGIVPYETAYVVRCSSHDKGKEVRNVCKDGCLGCGLCTRVCETGAITLEGNLAHIDQDKCIGCGKCAEKCPAKIIVKRDNR